MKNGKRFISLFLVLILLLGCLPLSALAAVSPTVYTLDNGFITVDVSGENGGFAVRTNKGNNLKKSDNDKDLLYHSSDYDTSFLSFRIDGKDYIFGGTYPGSSSVAVTQTSDDGEIIAQWMLGDLLFTEIISLPNVSSAEHGMVSVTAGVTNNGSAPVSVSARLLMDTYLGNIDYAFYEVAGSTVKSETVISGSAVPQNFYAVDDISSPSVQAYVVNSTLPDSIAFGHWSKLASTLYDFAPDSTLNFTNSVNAYMTADSAYAMYFDLGSIAPAAAGTFTSCYGVYSNSSVPVSDSVAVNASAPLRLYLNDTKDGYTDTPGIGEADFTVSAVLENYESETAADLSDLILSVRSTSGLMPLGSSGEAIPGVSYTSTDPYEVFYSELKTGEIKEQPLYFKADLKDDASYERITLEVYTNEVVDSNLLGEKTIYVLVPGVNGNIPAVTFASMTPDVIYSSGTRHLYLTVSNENLLADASHWNLYAYPGEETTGGVLIPHENISIKDGVMDIALTDDIRLATGSWCIRLEWTSAAVGAGIVSEAFAQTSGTMRFLVSDNPKYKNDCYGILTVAKFDEGNDSFCYQIRHFTTEDELKQFKQTAGTYYDGHGTFVGTLMDIRGEFTPEQASKVYDGNGAVVGYTNYTALSTKTLDAETRKYTVDNCITINNCLDFEGGTMSVYYEGGNEGGAVCVEFDGGLYTSDARTSVWKGKAAFTKIEQGEEYSLIEYDENGERAESEEDSSANHITLIWPNVFGAAQSLLGMAFKMAFAQLGVMKDGDEEIGRVLSFSAQLSLSFMQANPDYEKDESKQTYFDKIKGLWDLWTEDTPSLYQYAYNAGRINKLLDFKSVDEEEDDDAKRGVNTAVNVPDILFGCGEGFVGLHFKVKVGVANMIDSLPKIEGELEVNTINDWSFGFEGEMELEKFEMEAKLSFKSHDDIPIPDEIYFFIGGFKPGINVDGCGVLWLTGGGGGFSNLYDTIFLTQAVPPLKLCVAMSFSIVQILDGKAKIEIGLTGFSLEAEDIKILDEIEVIENIKLGLEWYPDIDLKAAINVNLFQGVIEGQGYIVLIGKDYTDWFFEMFARAALKIPKSIPLVGGMAIMSADLGISTEKIWGAVAVLNIGIGVTYYWGESSVNFGSAKDKANPTYPSLLEFEGVEAEYDVVPVYYDEESGQTLYAHFGSNLEVVPAAVGDGDLILMGASTLQTASDYLKHKFAAGDTVAVQLSYEAADEAEARTLAQSFTVKNDSGLDFGLVFYDAAAAAGWDGTGTDPNAGANANVSFDDVTGTATMSFTVTEPEDIGPVWTIETGIKTSAILYNVNPLPKLDSVSAASGAADAGSVMNVTWTGSELSELDSISFYLCENRDGESTQTSFDGGYPIGILQTGLTSGSADITLPATLPSGSYYLRAVYSEEDVVNGIVYSDTQVHIENANVPAAILPADVTCFPGGNLTYDIEVAARERTSGYSVTVYNSDGTATDVQSMTYDKAGSGSTSFSTGGSYEYEGTTYGLTGNRSYKIGITPYNIITDASGYKSIVYGEELIVDAGLLPVVTTPQVTVTASEAAAQVPYEYFDENGQQAVGSKSVYRSEALNFAVNSDTAVTARVFLDDEEIYSDALTEAAYIRNAASASLPLTGLTQGDHTLRITGKDAEGDGFSVTEHFTVDTLAPRLLLTSPLNGSYFSRSGVLTVSGVTDADALISVKVNGTTVRSSAPVQTAADGTFSFAVNIPDYNSASCFRVSVEAADAAGSSEARSADVYHGGLSELDGVKLMMDSSVLETGTVSTREGSISAQLTLLGTAGSQSFALPQESVYWEVYAAEGQASVTPGGSFYAESGAKGMLIGKYEVSQGAYLTVEAVFSDDIPLILSSTIGGTVNVAGNPVSGGSAVLTAIADAGYVFDHWVVNGADAGNAATIDVTIPTSGSVTVQAVFTAVSQPGNYDPSPAGDYILRSVPLPEGASENGYIPYYIDDNGEEVIIKVSEAEDGTLYYLNPTGRTVLFKNADVMFTDIDGHWAKDDIEFCAARGIFNGVGGGLFMPDESMTRSMFVMVLWNMENRPEPAGVSSFLDVPEYEWYAKAVAWGAENGLVTGIGNDLFAPNDYVTREQMCAFVNRYIKFRGYAVKPGSPLSFTDAGDISGWAVSDVDFCSSADIIHGYPGGAFGPQDYTTRAACCTVFHNLIGTVIDAYK